jgi:hypothetical protein
MRTPWTLAAESRGHGIFRHVLAPLEAAGRVPVPGLAGLAVGAIGLGAATLASTASLRAYWLEVWLIAAVLAAAAGAALLGHRASTDGRGFSTSVQKIFACLLPSLLAGGVLTAVLWRSGIEHAIPGTWLLLYGCALIYASSVTSKAIALLGALFVVIALVAFGLPESDQMSILGAGFGELHILYALVMKCVRRIER